MKMRTGLIVAASLMMTSIAHADPTPSNAELFKMLQEQQQTISELRAELKQIKQGAPASVAGQPAKAETTAMPIVGATPGAAPSETMASGAPVSAAYTQGPATPVPSLGRGAYISMFGGWGRGGDSSTNQLGTVYFVEAVGGPLAVNAAGQTSASNTWFYGTHIGYEGSYRSRILPIDILPAFELEGLYLPRTSHHATLENPTTRLPEHTFDDTFSMSTGVILANAVVSFPTSYKSITPYIGGGIGFAHISVDGTSTQINPAEVGINHFNSMTDSSAWGFAAQAKAGVRVALGDGAYVFGEYRYLYLGSVDQIFGSTDYPTHAASSPWTVRFGDTSYNLVNVGVGVGF